MKKKDMIEKLEELGVKDIPTKLKWQDFQTYFKDKVAEIETPAIQKPDEKSVEEKLERQLERQPDTRTPLEKRRAELYPQIVDLMRRLKGRSSATQDEIREMFSLYNAFYQRNDSANCGACVARVWKTFSKICKGHF